MTDTKRSSETEESTDNVNLNPLEETFRVIGSWHIPFLIMLPVTEFVTTWNTFSAIYYLPTLPYECATPNVTSACSKECKEINFKDNILKETLVSEWNLICDREVLRVAISAIFGTGIVLGNIFPLCLADRFGRRLIYIVAVISTLTTGICMGFIPWLWLFCIFYFFNGLGLASIEMLGYTIAFETVGRRHRAIVAAIILIACVTSMMCFPVLLYYLKTWRKVQIVYSGVSFVSLPVIFLIPESPRWLLVMGAREKAAKILRTAAVRNKLSDENIDRQVNAYKVNTQAGARRLLNLILSKKMRSRMLVLLFCSFTSYLGFHGALEYVEIISRTTFTYSGMAALEIPALILCIFLVHKWGRRPTLVLGLLVTGMALVVITMLPPNPVGLAYYAFVCFTAICLGSLMLCFLVFYIFSAELLPTIYRATGMGILNGGGIIGVFVAESLEYFGMVHVTAVVFGICVLFAAVLSFLFPETKNILLPDTFDDIEDFKKDSDDVTDINFKKDSDDVSDINTKNEI